MTLAEAKRRATLTVEETAELLGLGRGLAYQAARRGQLPTRRVGRRLVVPVPELLAWLAADSSNAGAPVRRSKGR